MKLGNFLTAMIVVYLLSILFGCWLNLKESRKEQLYWMERTKQEMIEHKRYLEQTMADVIVLVVINLFWGFVWYQVGKYVGRKEMANNE